MGHMKHCLLALLCLGITFTSSATRREELERAAELAVEKAAERAAERAVEKALESGNTTTQSKLIRESHSSVRKSPGRRRPGYEVYNDRSTEDEDDGAESEDWSKHYGVDWSRNLKSKWRYPRNRWSEEEEDPENPNADVSSEEKIRKNAPVPRTVEKRLPLVPYKSPAYQEGVRRPYTAEKKLPYPLKLYVNVPVQIPEPYNAEKQQMPYEVKVDWHVPYKVEVPVQESQGGKGQAPTTTMVPGSHSYRLVSYEFAIPVNRSYSIFKPHAVPLHGPVGKSYEVQEHRSIPGGKDFPFYLRVPAARSSWTDGENEYSDSKNKEDLAETESVGRKQKRSRLIITE